MHKKILLVEDEPILAVLTRLELEDLGYEVEVASIGTQAIHLARDWRPEVVLMDVEIEGKMDGAETAAVIQNELDIPVIFLTGSSDPETVRKCLAVKPYGYIRKPCTRETIQQGLNQAEFQRSIFKRLKKADPNPLHDPVTGISNRAMFLERVESAIQSGDGFALLYIDIDQMKQINLGVGHTAGDRILQLIAARLEAWRRQGDCIARVGSDEFAILLNHVQSEQEALDHANPIHLLMKNPFLLDKNEVFATVSIGVARFSSHHSTAQQILNDAETAVQQAKNRGAGNTAIFDRQLISQSLESFHFQNNLRRATRENELAVYYQPIVQLNARQIVGFEALLRWDHPEFGLIEANEIVPIAEQNGMILPIGRWVMSEACRQLAQWHRFDNRLSVHVNLTAKHLIQEDLVEEITSVLQETGVHRASFKIEVTESFVMENTERVLDTLKALHKLGVGLEIDDFGKGYSSLSYLHLFPIEAIKIDRSFVDKVHDPKSSEIISMIVNLGKKLQLRVIAEGIETEEELKQVRRAGCNVVQGYLFSTPVTAQEATRLLLEFDRPFAA